MPEAQIPEDVLETQEKQKTGEMQQWDTGQNELAPGSVQQREEDMEQQEEEQHKEEKQNTEDEQNVLELLQRVEQMQTHEVGETEERRDHKMVQQQTEERELQQVPVHSEGEQAEKKNRGEEELHQTKVSWTREEAPQTNLEQLTKVEWQQAEMQSKEWQDSGHKLEQNQNHQVLFRLKGV